MDHKCELESDVDEIAIREIAIYLQNMIEYLKFLINHPGF